MELKKGSNFEKMSAMKKVGVVLLGVFLSIAGFSQSEKSLTSGWSRPSGEFVIFPNPTPVGHDAYIQADWDLDEWVTFWIVNSKGEAEQGYGQAQEGGRIRVRGQQRPAGIYTIRWKNANGMWRQVKWVIG
jgi:hypothetical protein